MTSSRPLINDIGRLADVTRPRKQRWTGPRLRNMKAFCLLALAVLFLGCSRDPLARARAQKHVTSDRWSIVDGQSLPKDQQGGPAVALFRIKSQNQFDTPEGRAVATLLFFCEEDSTRTTVRLDKAVANGDVRVSFDGAAPTDQKWDYRPRYYNLLDVPKDLAHDFALNLSRSKTFDIEFTPKGGSRQRATFVLFNLKQLLSMESACKSSLADQPKEAAGAGPSTNGEAWTRSEMMDVVDGSTIADFVARSKNTISAPQGPTRASLYIFCGRDPQMMISTGEVRSGRVKLTFDDGPPSEQRWKPTRGFLLASSPPIKKLLKAKTLKLEFTPLNGESQVAIFDIANLKELVFQETSCNVGFR